MHVSILRVRRTVSPGLTRRPAVRQAQIWFTTGTQPSVQKAIIISQMQKKLQLPYPDPSVYIYLFIDK